MVITEIFSWWYASGWRVFISKIKSAFSRITDFFSMDSLIRTLFKPYRQISAGAASANSSMQLRIQMFMDRLVSRIVGFFSRILLLIIGTIIIIIGGILCGILIILWPLIPIMPIVGIILAIVIPGASL